MTGPVDFSLLNCRAKILPEWSTSVEPDIEADLGPNAERLPIIIIRRPAWRVKPIGVSFR
jgi:hypothetical protein